MTDKKMNYILYGNPDGVPDLKKGKWTDLGKELFVNNKENEQGDSKN